MQPAPKPLQVQTTPQGEDEVRLSIQSSEFHIAKEEVADWLRSALSAPQTSKKAFTTFIDKHFDPQKFKEAEVLIGHEKEVCFIQSKTGFEMLLNHITTFGSIFPTLTFINCSFHPECFEIFLQFIKTNKQLQALRNPIKLG